MGGELTNRYITAKRKLFEKAYSHLNDQQRKAVFHVNGPLLVLAGAGSGKTTVLVQRIAFIVRYGNAYHAEAPSSITGSDVAELESALSLPREELGVFLERFSFEACPPYAMLAITFTNKAANEMKERLASTLGESAAAEIWAGTFHSICVRMLRRFGDRIGVGSNFTIYDTDDTKKLISKCLKDMNIDEKLLPVKTVMSAISKCKEQLETPEEISVGKDFRMSRLVSVYKEYQSKLEAANALDFDDIIMKTVEMLKSCDDVREFYQRRFRYVCVDEYQDTNHAQFEFTRLISGGYRNIMVVGDDDQSIYKFRGATIKNILEFDKEYSDASVIKLEQNYRSTKNILECANAIIKNNIGRRGKDLWTDGGSGEKVTVRCLDDQNAEASFIADTVLDLAKREGRKFSDFAVLYRMNAQSNAIEKVLSKSGVPYRVLGGTRFYDRKEIKDIMSYLSLVNNTGDDLRLMRIINEPKRKIGQATIDAVAKIASADGRSMFDVISNADKYTALSSSAGRLLEFAALINRLIRISKTETLKSLFEQTIELTGYKQMLLDAGEEEYDRVQNIEELVSNAVEYEINHDDASLQGFLEEVALVSDIDNYDREADAVVMMTIHSAKGLEFPVVFLPGMENGIFPGQQNMFEREEMEEERRLAYVAVTRAKQRLYCLYAHERLMFGQTQYNKVSEFIKEMPSTCVDMSDFRRTKNYVFDIPKGVSPSYAQSGPTKSRTAGAGSNTSGGTSSQSFFTAPAKAQLSEVFTPGDDVLHQTFGKGTVLTVRHMGGDVMYEIAFNDFGIKKMMGTYAKLKRAK